MRNLLFACALVSALLAGCGRQSALERGADVARVLRAAEAGAPLRVVLLGGSITQGGHGWIGDWLSRTFPRSATFVQNSGLGGTGSDLGNFRLARDVIAYDPQLVFLESCVNDASRPDDDVLRDLESLVVRLKSLPRPPAVVMLIAGQEKGLDKSRHRKIAKRYGLLEIDLDAALHAKIVAEKLAWSDFMADAVHPNDRGNAFYSAAIAAALDAVRKQTPARPEASLPPLLSAKPLWRDADLLALRGAPGWWAEDVPPGPRSRIFLGLIGASQPGASLTLPFRGTAVGLLFPAAPEQGSFFAAIDGRAPQQIRENTHLGFAFRLLADDLPAGEHVLTLTLAPPEPGNRAFRADGPVKFGYVTVANVNAPAAAKFAAARPAWPRDLGRLRFDPIPNSRLVWTGPLGNDPAKKRYRAKMDEVFAPESATSTPAPAWTPVPTADGDTLDLAALGRLRGAGVFYVAARLTAAKAGPALLRSTITGGRRIWVNGQPLPLAPRDAENDQPLILPVELRAGRNEILWKIGSINQAATFSAALAVPPNLSAKFTLPGN